MSIVPYGQRDEGVMGFVGAMVWFMPISCHFDTEAAAAYEPRVRSVIANVHISILYVRVFYKKVVYVRLKNMSDFLV